MIVYNNPSNMPVGIPVMVVVFNPDEIPGSAKLIYIPVINTIPGPGKYFIILVPEFTAVTANIYLVTLAVRPVEGITGSGSGPAGLIG